jgi:hypothetical protein
VCGRRSKRVWLSWALLVSLSVCTCWAADGPVTVAELVTELQTISAMLRTAQTEYQTVSTTLSRLQTEEMPRLKMQLSDLERSYADYRRTVSREIDRLRAVGLGAVGVAVVAVILAAIAIIT